MEVQPSVCFLLVFSKSAMFPGYVHCLEEGYLKRMGKQWLNNWRVGPGDKTLLEAKNDKRRWTQFFKAGDPGVEDIRAPVFANCRER